MKKPPFAGRPERSSEAMIVDFPQIDTNALDLDDAEDIYGLVQELIDGTHPGILTTVDAEGRPQARWMSTFCVDTFPVFYTLTAPGTRKVTQIQGHPEVNWMFFNRDLSLIVTLGGKARVVTEAKLLRKAWKRVKDKTLAYFLRDLNAGPDFIAIETRVESIECNSPKNFLRFSVKPGEIRPWPPESKFPR
jgi:general stress protein 26